MRLCDFLQFLLDDALEDARLRQRLPADRLGFLGAEQAIAECRACMDDNMAEGLREQLRQARLDSAAAVATQAPDQWFWFAREIQTEWIACVVSVILLQQHLPTIVPPTRGAAIAAARLAGLVVEE
ncbi:hypothetical protein [Roseomonas elaeocarpi]|uniref:Uncharacterized protein n=1 Tax=Roseomonas elaeocarpi TaxID=907779 RepID=A0ABV6JP30_9PROT